MVKNNIFQIFFGYSYFKYPLYLETIKIQNVKISVCKPLKKLGRDIHIQNPFCGGFRLKLSLRMIFRVLRLEAVFEPQAKKLGA